jgi:TPR repeat protein
MYVRGQGVQKDHKLAVKWYRKSAEQGNSPAQSNLGLKYREGLGVPKDYELAFKWFRESAEQGDASAQRNLALMYKDNGHGVPKDYILAYMWFNLSATNGKQISKVNRNEIEDLMSPQQIISAQRLTRECVRKKYKEC